MQNMKKQLEVWIVSNWSEKDILEELRARNLLRSTQTVRAVQRLLKNYNVTTIEETCAAGQRIDTTWSNDYVIEQAIRRTHGNEEEDKL